MHAPLYCPVGTMTTTARSPNCPLQRYLPHSFLCPEQLTVENVEQSLAIMQPNFKISQVVVTVVHCQSEESRKTRISKFGRSRGDALLKPNMDAFHVISDAFTRLIAIGVLNPFSLFSTQPRVLVLILDHHILQLLISSSSSWFSTLVPCRPRVTPAAPSLGNELIDSKIASRQQSSHRATSNSRPRIPLQIQNVYARQLQPTMATRIRRMCHHTVLKP